MAVPKTNTGPPIPLTIDYQDPDGVWWSLSDLTFSQGWVCSAIAGIEGLPIAMQTIPLLDGTSLPLTYLPATGTIGLAILVGRPANGDQFAYYKNLDAVVRAFYNRRNSVAVPGTLRVTRPDGSQRAIATYTTSGLNTPEVGINDMTLFSLALSTPDPYWSDYGNDNYLYFKVLFANQGILPITFPSPGILFNVSQESGSFKMTNWGDAYAYPVWTLTGPGIFTVTNTTTPIPGSNPVSYRTWTLNYEIPPGNTVQLITEPGQSLCHDITNPSAPVNLWGYLVFNGAHNLFPLMAGDNYVTVSVTGATAQTAIAASYPNRWLRA